MNFDSETPKPTSKMLVSLFAPGDTIKTKYASAQIIDLNSAYIRLRRSSGGNPVIIRPANVLCIADNISAIDNASGSLESRVQAVLKPRVRPDNAITADTSSETYIYAFAKELLRRAFPKTIEEYTSIFDSLLEKTKDLTQEELQQRAKLFPKVPCKVFFSGATIYHRNPYVVRLVLNRANGICELCERPAPFLRRSDNSPYLEVHHIKPLSTHGPDTEDNAQALCPNCHRLQHHGPIPT